ncbi:glucose-1-phosphate thymidylyltransferase [Romboutsia maritimum]|uniref:Glucose-1-phosphate thymidylyltransferase n=1 Tax=Romboutsia maritimum TaxID=2020948 RepID=A0A371IRR3_9FIRM|nr:glucose-1-phosphate thymidylyltransferase RfbA [Romboutsia maritimum]RDY23172.1 glucose-1-phosphate thymidylyltransferase [Romboutsia maritimum]
MKGIILAGGSGTRLYPLTKALSKQALPIYNKPMIYYPLSVLMLCNIRDILIISTPRDIEVFKEMFFNGSDIGLNISYASQDKPRGIADAFIVGKDFIKEDNVALILGDNIFYGYKFEQKLINAINNNKGATIFGYHVENPCDFGVVEFDNKYNALSIEEKPKQPKSNYAVPGLYFYNNEVVEIAKKVKPSDRGELEITSINNEYLKKGNLKVELLEKETAWIDTGTYEGLLNAAKFIETIEKRQNIHIGYIEEIAYKKGYINKEKLIELSKSLIKTEYGKYLLKVANGG